MSASQSGKTPRRTTRRSTATPVRDVSPSGTNTRGVSTALRDTPATRRSTRAASRKPDQTEDAVNNKALPEIQTRQSYAYGSSKTPLLPDQLHARDPLTLKQVADQMESAIDRAQQNLDARSEESEETHQQPKPQAENQRTQRRTSKDPSPPASVVTEVQKKQRTAAWADSLHNSQLQDIEEEEEQQQVDTPETRRTEPSSFPSGIFDQSYQYERGLRPPRKPPKPRNISPGARLGAIFDRSLIALERLRQTLVKFLRGIGKWFSRLFASVSNVVSELPDSRVVVILTRAFFIIALVGFMSYALCFGYSQFLCDPAATSRVSTTLQSWCGGCQTISRNYTSPPINADADLHQLTSALKHMDSQMRNIESRFNARLDSQVAAIHTDIDGLRKEQNSIVDQIDQISNQPSHQPSFSDVASPLIPKVNFFSPANGAIINPQLTSPTRQAPMALPVRLLTRILGIQKYKVHNPVTALEAWNDVGDCWCAAASLPGQDRVRLGVSIKEYIYPTELVIEHPSKDATLMPETAPREVELWADFTHLNEEEWTDFGLDDLSRGHDLQVNGFGQRYGLLANVNYNLAGHGNQLQTFALNVNQYGELKHAARDFMLRVKSTHGGEYGCLYRVRLHGIPVIKRKELVGETETAQSVDEDEVVG